MSGDNVVRAISLADDLDGRTAEKSVSFALDGVHYEIDLSSDNAAPLREVLWPWIRLAQQANRPPHRPGGVMRLVVDHHQTPEIRRWARSRGLYVAARGRLPTTLVYAYVAEHGGLCWATT
jgi:hypothetical protein